MNYGHQFTERTRFKRLTGHLVNNLWTGRHNLTLWSHFRDKGAIRQVLAGPQISFSLPPGVTLAPDWPDIFNGKFRTRRCGTQMREIFDSVKGKLAKRMPFALFRQHGPEEKVAPLAPLVRTGQARRSLARAPLTIPCPDPSAEEALREEKISQGQFLARQERWSDLSALMAEADRTNEATPSGMPLAELYGYGARADVCAAAEHLLLHGRPEEGAPVLAGIEALEDVLSEQGEDPYVALVVAHAHMDIGWAWRGNGWDQEVPEHNRAIFTAHFERAQEILKRQAENAQGSALFAAAKCALMAALYPSGEGIADRYGCLIELSPRNPQTMRALGMHLLPRWHGTYEELELEARRTLARTTGVWGSGGYSWVMLDAVASDPLACAGLDVELFTEGLRDILARQGDPYTVNLLAAYCAQAKTRAATETGACAENRAAIAACADWIIRDHLTELHPLLWAHAARGFDNTLKVYSPKKFAAAGREDAFRFLTDLFARELEAGKRVIFTEEGMKAIS